MLVCLSLRCLSCSFPFHWLAVGYEVPEIHNHLYCFTDIEFRWDSLCTVQQRYSSRPCIFPHAYAWWIPPQPMWWEYFCRWCVFRVMQSEVYRETGREPALFIVQYPEYGCAFIIDVSFPETFRLCGIKYTREVERNFILTVLFVFPHISRVCAKQVIQSSLILSCKLNQVLCSFDQGLEMSQYQPLCSL